VSEGTNTMTYTSFRKGKWYRALGTLGTLIVGLPMRLVIEIKAPSFDGEH